MIREIESGEWQLYRDVRLRALAEAPYAFLDKLADAEARPEEFWRERATPSEKSTIFVIVGDKRFEGTAGGFMHGEDVILVGMWVDPSLRGTGLAAGLVEAVVDWARRRGAPRVVLSVEGGNDRARRLYERCGFVLPGEEPDLPYEQNPGMSHLVRPT